MKEYQVEVVVHMQVLVKVEATDERSAQMTAGQLVKENVYNGGIIDLTIADTYIIE